jgi:hypothetical protein
VTAEFANMKNKFHSPLLWAALLCTTFCSMATSHAHARCELDDFPRMDEMKLFSVLDDAIHNNRPMMVQGFIADHSMDAVIDYYHRKWKGRFNDSAYAQWYQVSTLTDDCLMTVQVAAHDDGSQGRLVISNVPTVSSDTPMGEGVLKPTDANVVSDLATVDGPKSGRVTLLAVGESPTEVAQFYRSNLAASGWQQQQDFRKDQAHVLVFRQGLNVMNILIMPSPEVTQVLINSETVD